MNRMLLLVTFLFGTLFSDEEYRFAGKHFVGSYLNCDSKALTDIDRLIAAMDRAVSASGATILATTPYIFPPNGITIVYTLSESHASIHTYPEHGSCFVDLFTCGDNCSSEKFHQALSEYLKPEAVDAHLFIRNETIEEVPFHH